MARILLYNEHEHGSWHLTAVLPTYTITALQPTRPRADTPATLIACTLLLPISNEHVTTLRFNLMAGILLLYEHEHEHGSWYLTAVLLELVPYCSATDKTSRHYACDITPITRHANTPAT
jgi:hypothetical protein